MVKKLPMILDVVTEIGLTKITLKSYLKEDFRKFSLQMWLEQPILVGDFPEFCIK